jgi:uncharacterized protein YjiK
MTIDAAAKTMTTTIKSAAFAVILLGACGEPAPDQREPLAPIPNSIFATEASRQWRLPLEILEISGMAVSPDGRLFAHDDERAVIYEINAEDGAFVNRFALGAPLTGDFEGLAIDNDGVFWMITSEGQVLRFAEGQDGRRVQYETLDTGLRRTCEIEGLAFLAAADSLIIACKENHARDMRDTIALYQWRPGGEATLWRTFALEDVQAIIGVEHFRPSSIEFDPRSGRTILLSASDPALIELEGERVVAARRLGRIHTQAEGAAIMPDGSLVISDEGSDTRALLSVYDRVSQ